MSEKTDKIDRSTFLISYFFFFMFGIFPFIMAVIVTLKAIKSCESQSWQPTSAYVSNAKLREHSDDDGDISYTAHGTYHYQWEGKNYTATRINFFSMGSDEERNIFEHLKSAKQQEVPINVWVNPESPSESVIYRGVRWGVVIVTWIAALIFGFAAKLFLLPNK